MSDFTLANYFIELRALSEDDAVDQVVEAARPRLRVIIRPEPLGILWDSANALPNSPTRPDSVSSTPFLRYGLYKLFENLFQVNHRNQGVLASLNLVRSLFPRYCECRADPNASERERHALQKLLRKSLEMGATTEEARRILQHAVEKDGEEEKLDLDMLDLVRYGMKSRWLEHFSMESPAALVVHDENSKGLPFGGFTFMEWLYLSGHPSDKPCVVFKVTHGTRDLFQLSVRKDGKLLVSSSSQAENEAPFVSSGTVRKNRWVHLCVVHYPHRGTNPSLRGFACCSSVARPSYLPLRSFCGRSPPRYAELAVPQGRALRATLGV